MKKTLLIIALKFRNWTYAVLHLYATNILVNKECTFKETAENRRDTEDSIQHHKVPTEVPASMRMRSCKPKPITIFSFRELQAFISITK
jgi:hypothetical protein